VLLTAVLIGAGCASVANFGSKKPTAPTGMPVHVIANWQPYVMFGPDPANNGRRIPSLGGRFYLFGPEIALPIACPGRVEVMLFPEPADPANPEKPTAVWTFDDATLKTMLHKDGLMGWGYNLQLPWLEYRPEITRVRLRLRFDPVNGPPIFSEDAKVVFHGQGPPEIVESSHVVGKAVDK
jgi:hypothetical protein